MAKVATSSYLLLFSSENLKAEACLPVESVPGCTIDCLVAWILTEVRAIPGLPGAFLLIDEVLVLKFSTYFSIDFLSRIASLRRNMKSAQKAHCVAITHEKSFNCYIGFLPGTALFRRYMKWARKVLCVAISDPSPLTTPQTYNISIQTHSVYWSKP